MKRIEFLCGLLFIFFMIQLSTASTYSNENTGSSDTPSIGNKDYHIADGSSPIPLISNVIENPSFEEYNPNGGPSDWGYWGSAYQEPIAAYQDFTANGSYAGVLKGQGNILSDAYPELNQYPSMPYAYIKDNVSLDFFWYVSSNPDLDIYSRCTVRVQMATESWSYYDLYYDLSYNYFSSRTNDSDDGFYDMNSTIQEWHKFSRNITDDYEKIPEFGSIDPTLRVYQIELVANSPSIATGLLEIVFDDFTLRNSTFDGFLVNGDFEQGNENAWGKDSASQSYISSTNDKTDGEYAVNMTTKITHPDSYSSLSLYYGVPDYPEGYYAEESGSCVLDFDWKYNDYHLAGSSQEVYLTIRARNQTYGYPYFSFICYLGQGNDMIQSSNSTQYTYFPAEGFGIRNVWHHETIDMYELFNEKGITNVSLIEFQFYSQSSDTVGVFTELLIDNFKLWTYPLGDPGFEQDWLISPSQPITGWQHWTGSYDNYELTDEAHSGNWAANISAVDGQQTGIYRDTNGFPVDSGLFTDFWWYLSIFGEDSYSYVDILIQFQAGYELHYIVGADTYYISTSSNGTYDAFYFVEGLNEIGVWHNLNRNITNDLNATFGEGPGSWNLTRVILMIYAASGAEIVAHFDDMHFQDRLGPMVHIVEQITPTPMYYDAVLVRVTATDTSSRMGTVNIHYHDGASWNVVGTTFTNDGYEGWIPSIDYGTTVLYYVNATDQSNQFTVEDNDGSYYSYVPGDDVNPEVTINTPLDTVEVDLTVDIEVDATDDGSGVAFVKIYDGVTLLYNDTSSPYGFSWNTRTVANGTHTISAVVHDYAGLTNTDEIQVDVQNDVAPPTLSTIMLNPSSPEHDDSVEVSVGVADFTEVDTVLLYYRIGSGDWQNVEMISASPLYSADIPAAGWNTVVQYYVVANDTFGQTESMGSEMSPYSYTVADLTAPFVNVTSPENGEIVSGSVTITVDSNDAGSGIAFIEFYDGETLLYNDSTYPYEYEWDTEATNRGAHTLTIIGHDNAGLNTSEEIILYVVQSDIEAPEFSDIQLTPGVPQYGETVQASVAITDRSGIDNATLYYKIGDASWQSTSMTTSSSLYKAEIPAADWGTIVLYYIESFDESGNLGSVGNETSPLSYTVGDNVLPTLSVSGPPSSTILNGSILFSVSGSDEGSGISELQILVNGVAEASSTSVPLTFTWDTTTVANGFYTLTFQIEDGAGNTASVEVEYEVNNPEGFGALIATFDNLMSEYGFFIGAGAMLGLFIVGKIFSRRRAAKAVAGGSAKKGKKSKKAPKKKSK